MAKKSVMTSSNPIGESAAPRSNSAVVREILDSGVTKPSEIVRIALEKYELNISLGLVNAAKMSWKKKSDSAKLEKAPRKSKDTVPGDQRGNGKTASAGTDDTVRNGKLSELDVAKFALKMGGVDAAIAALRDLVK